MTSYHNVLVKGPTQENVISFLNSHAISTYVSPTECGCTVIYADNPVPRWVERLSEHFHCPAFHVMEFDGEVWWYWLYDSGKLVDEYNSRPGWETGEYCLPPSGGNAGLLCCLFDRKGCEKAVARVLHHEDRRTDGPTQFMDSSLAHQELANLLGFPVGLVTLSVDYVDHDHQPGGYDRSAFLSTGEWS